MSKQRIALVTGGTGFIGVNLIKRLTSAGWIVHVIVRQKSDLNVLEGSIKK
ncbi:MAG: GDP-mannose 4,6-dehydratase, partial [Rhodobacterales bacterium]